MSDEPDLPSDGADAGADDPNRRRGRRGRRGRGGAGFAPAPGAPSGFRPPAPGFRPSAPGFRPPAPGFRPPGQGFRPPAPGGFRGPRPGGPRPAGPRPGSPRPPLRPFDQGFRPAPRPPMPMGDDEGSSQAQELAAYERRQAQGGGRPGMRGGGFQPQNWAQRRDQRRAGQYQEVIRRVTAGPHTAAPSHEAGEPIAGPHAVLEAMRAGRTLRSLYILQDRGPRTGTVAEVITEAQEHGLVVKYVDKMELARLSPIENHQGVVAIVEGRAGVELDEVLAHLDTVETPLVLVLDSLQDPQNFGVLLRSGEGAGVDGVIIPRHRSVGLTAAVARTSAGASEHLLVGEVANLRQAIDALKEKGIWVVATDMSGDLLYDEVDYRGPTAFVIGGEHEGIRRLVLEGCDQVVRIPMEGQVEALNAASAGTVLLYEALRQRTRNAPPSPTRTPRPEPKATAPRPESEDGFDGDEGDDDGDDPGEPEAENHTAEEPVPVKKAAKRTIAKKPLAARKPVAKKAAAPRPRARKAE